MSFTVWKEAAWNPVKQIYQWQSFTRCIHWNSLGIKAYCALLAAETTEQALLHRGNGGVQFGPTHPINFVGGCLVIFTISLA